jgi:hypothetical protein
VLDSRLPAPGDGCVLRVHFCARAKELGLAADGASDLLGALDGLDAPELHWSAVPIRLDCDRELRSLAAKPPSFPDLYSGDLEERDRDDAGLPSAQPRGVKVQAPVRDDQRSRERILDRQLDLADDLPCEE